jgi:hypothetical protein
MSLAINSAASCFGREYLPQQPNSAANVFHRSSIPAVVNAATINFNCNELRRSSIFRFQIKIPFERIVEITADDGCNDFPLLSLFVRILFMNAFA